MKYNCHKDPFLHVLISWLKLGRLKHELWDCPGNLLHSNIESLSINPTLTSCDLAFLHLPYLTDMSFQHGTLTVKFSEHTVVSISAGICKKIPMSMFKRKHLVWRTRTSSAEFNYPSPNLRQFSRPEVSGKGFWRILSFEITRSDMGSLSCPSGLGVWALYALFKQRGCLVIWTNCPLRSTTLPTT
jgi:hypothetical protein